jgi:hypothetical protein
MKVVRLSASRTGRLYFQEMFLVLIFTRGWVDPRAIARSEGNMSLKNPVTPPAIDPGTVRLVAQRLNHYATPGPLTAVSACKICYVVSIVTGLQSGRPEIRGSISESETAVSSEVPKPTLTPPKLLLKGCWGF